ncbi:MAG: undecaprenyl-diphosphate phosphatase [Kamptonema sp. SIO4C4]|nr:undecaprenyl-diphosphate phosphatase [Kamptonema sp. SIO4C4]
MAVGFGWAIALSALISQFAIAQESPVPSSPAQSLNFLQAVVLGAVQGLTEFIPISSTAHLKAVPVFLGWGDPGVTFTAVIQLGSIAAVLWYFWQDIVHLSFGAWTALQKRNYQATDLRIAVGIAVGTIPIVVCGLLLKALVPDLDNSPIRSMTAIAIASIIMGLLLGVAEKMGSRLRGFDKLGMKDGITMGFAQCLALIPGVSRSGSTITAGLFFGLERATAARFSFLLGIPAITLAGLVQLKTDVIDTGLSSANLMPLLVGTISSAIFSYLAIAWLIRYLQSQSTWVFVWYRVLFGIVILAGVTLEWFV